jgi:hypothetical protein
MAGTPGEEPSPFRRPAFFPNMEVFDEKEFGRESARGS